MVVLPGLSASLGAVGKQIIHFGITETVLSVEASSSVRRANARGARVELLAGMVSIGANSGLNPAWADL